MDRREMRKRIAGIVASNMPGYAADPSRKKKTLEEQLEDELLMICKFRPPSFSKRQRWERAIHEVRMMIYNHAGLGD
jgi:ribosomal protein S7